MSIINFMKAHVAVMAAVERVPKNGFNKFHNYEYATESDLLKVIRPAMAENGLALFPSQTHVSEPDASGNVTVRVEYTYAHVSGEVWPHPLVSHGVGNDRAKNGSDGDKAVYKAVTGANKYMLFKLFQVDTGDDPEAETVSNEERPQPSKTTAKPAAPKQSAVEDQVRAFAEKLNAMLEAGATAAEIYKFEQEHKARFDRMRKEFMSVPVVKEAMDRVDSIYEKMG